MGFETRSSVVPGANLEAHMSSITNIPIQKPHEMTELGHEWSSKAIQFWGSDHERLQDLLYHVVSHEITYATMGLESFHHGTCFLIAS